MGPWGWCHLCGISKRKRNFVKRSSALFCSASTRGWSNEDSSIHTRTHTHIHTHARMCERDRSGWWILRMIREKKQCPKEPTNKLWYPRCFPTRVDVCCVRSVRFCMPGRSVKRWKGKKEQLEDVWKRNHCTLLESCFPLFFPTNIYQNGRAKQDTIQQLEEDRSWKKMS